MNLYTPEGWVDAPAIMAGALTFNIIVGGRGTGKTFGFLQQLRLDNPRPFLLMKIGRAHV